MALYAGSFDPIHLGHLRVIEHVARIHDQVIVAVLANPQKPSGLFTPEARLRLIAAATSHLPSVRSVRFHGLTVQLAREEGATVLVRSAHKERGDEVSMAAMNLMVGGIHTLFVPPEMRTRTISSSLVRRLFHSGQLTAAQELVPAAVGRALAEIELATRAEQPAGKEQTTAKSPSGTLSSRSATRGGGSAASMPHARDDYAP